MVARAKLKPVAKGTGKRKSARRKIVAVSHFTNSILNEDGSGILLSNELLEDLDEDLIQDELCRRHLEPYIKRVFEELNPAYNYLYNWHIGCVAEHLEAMYLGQILRLIINLPTRTLKSLCGSVAFPSWVLGREPHEKFICCSFDSSLATELSVNCRNIILSPWYTRMFPDTKLASDQNEKRKFETTKHGHRASTTVGGSILGRGGRYKIMDDPIDPEGGFSRAELIRCNRFIDQTWSSREDDPKSTRDLLIMQRVHTDDPTGHLLKQGGYEHLKLPQEAPHKQTITFPLSGKIKIREKGELLHEERTGEKEVKAFKTRLGSYGYSAQQQQEPVPLGGGRIKLEWFSRYNPSTLNMKSIIEIVQSWDTASKGKEVNALSACITFGWDGKHAFVLNCYADRLRYPELRTRARKAYQTEHADTVLIEDKSSGQSLIQDLKDEEASQYIPMEIVAIEPVGDKITRLDVNTKHMEAGIIVLPEYAPWLAQLESDLTSFPDPMYWDRLDAFSQYLNWKFARVEPSAPADLW